MSDEEPRSSGDGQPPEWQPLLAAARAEHPNTELADRVLSELSYRQRVFEAAPAQGVAVRRHAKVVSIAVGSLSIAAAAAAVVMFSQQPWRRPLASAEPSQAAPAGVAPATSPRQPPFTSVASAESLQAATGVNVPQRVTSVPIADPCRERVVAAGRQPLIDDFEDGDDAISPFEGRLGLWRWVRDTDRPGTAPALLPIPLLRPAARNKQALHVRGARLQDWGASVEFTFQPACYDASAYRGVSIRARGPGRIYLSAREVRLIPPQGGGTCQGVDCYNAHAIKFDLTAQYATYEARWFELQQRGYGKPALDPSHLHSITILIRPEDTPYDLWFDDVRFIE